MEAKINQLAPVENFDKAYIIAQYVHEQGFRGATFPDLLSWMQTRLDLTGTDLIDPTPPGTEANPAVIAPGPEGKKGKFEPSPGFYQGFPEITADKRWYFYWDGSTWTLVDMGELPDNAAKAKDWQAEEEYDRNTIVTHNGLQWIALVDTDEEPSHDSDDWDVIGGVEKTNLIIEESGKAVTEKAVFNYSLPIFSDKALPFGYSLFEIDRPDFPEKRFPIVMNELGQVVQDLNKRFYLLDDFDRPDLAGFNVYIDINRRLIKMDRVSSMSGGGGSIDVSATDVYYNPSTQEAYSIGSSGTEWVDANVYHERWEPLLNDDKYVSRQLLGTSTEDGLPIYKYEFKPDNPSRKAILFGGTHGSEKMSPVILYRFFNNLVENYSSANALQWARKNVHFIVVPLLSPDSYERRTRRVKETAPFNASWTKSGNVVTISFDQADFPNTNPNVHANDYFSNPGIVGKTMLSVIDSSDQESLPDNGYVIQSAINGRTITVNATAGGASSGTCKIFVSADPNRSFDMPSNPWLDFTPTGSMTKYNEPVSVRNDNKGTKPYSLKESVYAKAVMDDNPDATFLIDFHNGAGDYDFRWNANVDFDRSGADIINELHKLYTSDFAVGPTNNNVLSGYASQVLNMNGTTVEWGQHSPITDKIATDSQRWFGNLILIGSWYYKNKLQ
ncbi:MAG TPA: hypothetical protein H9825_09110 [Candidatus Sphingobacterium stercorigallinarum]|nr:hypothetical protein [Candidatus Sphingobacterium stercorigallinarum]